MKVADVPGIPEETAGRLQRAGFGTVEALLAADPARLAPAIDFSPAEVRYLQESARLAWERQSAAAGAPPDAPVPRATMDVVREEVEDLRVVLKDRAATARVKLGSVWHDDIPIVISKVQESEARIRESLKENAVLLREKAATASVRINGKWTDEVPLYKERLREMAEDGRQRLEEIRVRVDEIRETRKQRAPAEGGEKSSFLKRIFG